MQVTRILARGIALLMLLVSVSAWAVTQQQVLTAIKNKDASAHEKLAAYAAENNTSVAEVVGTLVAANPSLAGSITAAGVKANPSNAGEITRAALTAVQNNPNVTPAQLQAVQAAIIQNAVANAPEGQIANIRSAAATEGVPASVVNSAVVAGQTAASAATASASLVSSLPTNSTTYTGDASTGGGVSSP